MSIASPILSAPAKEPGVCRVSSIIDTHEGLIAGTMVAIPPKHMMASSSGHETAIAIESAKRHMSDSDGLETPTTPPASTVTGSFVFMFDIDGVLIRGGKPIPEAIEAMKVLNGANEWNIQV